MKVNGIEIQGDLFAYDGCHKIYIIESEEDLLEVKDTNYNILPIEDLPRIWEESCELKFIHPWSLPQDRDYLGQFEDAVFTES